MNRRIVAVWISLVILLSFIVLVTEITPMVESTSIIYVDDVPGEGSGNPAENYTSIQDAINASKDGETIYVFNGTYYENVVIDKTINLTGENRNTTIIDANGSGDVALVNVDWVNITGFSFVNSGSPSVNAGLRIESNYNTIYNNNFSNNKFGIHLVYSTNNSLIDNNVSNNWDGIHLSHSPFNNISRNHLSANKWHGIYLFTSCDNYISENDVKYTWIFGILLAEYSNGNTIIDNNVVENENAVYIPKSSFNTIANNNISSNTNDGIRLINTASNNIIINNFISSNGRESIYLYECSNTTIINNIIRNNDEGIRTYYSDNNTVLKNDIRFNKGGIHIYSSPNSTIANNTIFNSSGGISVYTFSNDSYIADNYISNNQYYALNSFSSYYNNFTRNLLIDNEGGIRFFNAYDNVVWGNDIINNTTQATDNTNNRNQWNADYPSGGNYWSDFDEPIEGAYDDYEGIYQNITGSDGIVDNGTIEGGGKNPYVIDADSQDNYPLMEPNKDYMILKQGWNLISIPLIQNDQNLTKVLETIKYNYDAVQRYEGADKNDQWKHYQVNKHFGNDLSNLKDVMGFWIHITSPGNTLFIYHGTPPTSNQSIPLHPGWNMVGYPSLSKHNRTAGLNNLTFGMHVDAIWTFDASTQRWEEIGPSDSFKLEKGYWIHATQECVWEVPL